MPERPSLGGLEDKWAPRWEAAGVARFDRSRPRSGVYAIDSPPLTVSGSLHVGHVLSYTHTDLVARFHRMRGRSVFYPVAWDDNGLPTERRAQAVFGVRCEPTLAVRPGFPAAVPAGPEAAGAGEPARLHRAVRAARGRGRGRVRGGVAAGRAVGRLVAGLLDDRQRSRRTSQLAFLRDLRRGDAYRADAPTLWDVDFQTAVAQAELVDREVEGAWYAVDFLGPAGPVTIETTRPELLPACVAVVAHPGDERYAALCRRHRADTAVRCGGAGSRARAGRPGQGDRPGDGVHVRATSPM